MGHVLIMSPSGRVVEVGWAEEGRNVRSFRALLLLIFLGPTAAPPHTNGNGEEDEGERASYCDSHDGTHGKVFVDYSGRRIGSSGGCYAGGRGSTSGSACRECMVGSRGCARVRAVRRRDGGDRSQCAGGIIYCAGNDDGLRRDSITTCRRSVINWAIGRAQDARI